MEKFVTNKVATYCR